MNVTRLETQRSEAIAAAVSALSAIAGLTVRQDVALSTCTRFGVGGPADVYAETAELEAFIQALKTCRGSGLAYYLIGEGSNLIASDDGFRGIILRLVARGLRARGQRIFTDAGVILQDLVDFSVDRGLRGLESLAGIPGSVGAAIYGNAGAYGHAISERVRVVRFLDGEGIRQLDNSGCRFQYRESIFKQNKDWFIIDAELEMEPGDAAELRKMADDIVRVRNEKFPPTMKCAGSIFKNLMLKDLPAAIVRQVPPEVIREGKVPAAYFLEQVGAKGMQRGRIHVATYHANLLYNEGGGTADDLLGLIRELSLLVQNRFGIRIEEEVQYLGLPPPVNQVSPQRH